MRNIAIILAFVLSSSAFAADFCGRLSKVSWAYLGGDDEDITSIVLKNSYVTDIESTRYNDKFMKIINNSNTVSDGYDTIEVLRAVIKKEFGTSLLEMAADGVNPWTLSTKVCLKNFKLGTRRNGSLVEARANSAERIEVTVKRKKIFAGDIKDSVKIMNSLKRKSAIAARIKVLKREQKDLDRELDVMNPELVDSLKVILK